MSRQPVASPVRESGSLRPIRTAAARSPAAEANPTFGLHYWALGLLAATPALLTALVFLLRDARLPRGLHVPLGPLLGALLVALVAATVAAHYLDYPAWSQPLVGLLPALGLFLPAAVLHGEVAARVEGDPDLVVAAPLLATWLLLVAGAIVAAAAVAVVARHAPSFAGTALLPPPILLAWALLLTPRFTEEAVARGLGAAFALIAVATFVAWIAPAAWRPFVPLAALGLQFAAFWALGLRWPAFGGATRPAVALDVALFVALVLAVALAPLWAAWVRREGWADLRRLFGTSRE
ncbi:MAG TPA: hypothetical protein VFW96_04465 [Thermomicrobiales bacterium]|nr:hypothetical protein [Thermomicrobiales bacterium]